MGTLTGAQLISEVRRFFADRADLTDATILQWLNTTQESLARQWQWEELDETEEKTLSIAGTAKADKIVTPTNTYRDFYSVRLVTTEGDSGKLTRLSKRQFDAKFPEPEFHGRNDPIFYTYFQDKLELFPVQAVAHTLVIRGMKWATALANDAVVSNFDRKDDILIYLTVSPIADSLGQYDRASRFFGIANAKIEQAKDEQQTKPDLEIKPDFEISGGLIGQYWKDPFIKAVR